MCRGISCFIAKTADTGGPLVDELAQALSGKIDGVLTCWESALTSRIGSPLATGAAADNAAGERCQRLVLKDLSSPVVSGGARAAAVVLDTASLPAGDARRRERSEARRRIEASLAVFEA